MCIITDCISEINSTQRTKDIDVVIKMYNLIEYSKKFMAMTSSEVLKIYGYTIKINQITMAILLIFLLMIIPIFHLHIENVIGRTENDGKKN